ncbi:unnamed protein product [Vitrella brassicaformis CCMP3155]|uniref:Uncharacterized protein n=1 Tax=Vitrella brassicaformis (strain CCMP3155) TaxID=1169540 RepID=A0A0G4GXS4_VITBC|nr:unnamed protein product [Vitrella brassicaformis CCMP3155]|eukprot:CEM35910.1 unnamed protein product [Vitrella brassicaformis CCMP3155]
MWDVPKGVLTPIKQLLSREVDGRMTRCFAEALGLILLRVEEEGDKKQAAIEKILQLTGERVRWATQTYRIKATLATEAMKADKLAGMWKREEEQMKRG